LKTFLIFCSFGPSPPNFIGTVTADSEINACKKLGINHKQCSEDEHGRTVYGLPKLECSVFFAEPPKLLEVNNAVEFLGLIRRGFILFARIVGLTYGKIIHKVPSIHAKHCRECGSVVVMSKITKPYNSSECSLRGEEESHKFQKEKLGNRFCVHCGQRL
jgi:hypothetical protein